MESTQTHQHFDTVEAFEHHVEALKRSPAASKRRLMVCCGTGCIAGGAKPVAEAFERKLAQVDSERRPELNLIMKKTGCHGFCEKGPIVVMMPEGLFYKNVKPMDVDRIVEDSVISGKVVQDLLYEEPSLAKPVEKVEQIAFYAKQTRVAMRNIGQMDPANIDDYLLRGGYGALAKALKTMSPDAVLQAVCDAKLRGRGGGGFDAGRKWKSCKNSPAQERCNLQRR